MLNPNCSFGLVTGVCATAAPNMDASNTRVRPTFRFCMNRPLMTVGFPMCERSLRRGHATAGFNRPVSDRRFQISNSPDDFPVHPRPQLSPLERNAPVDDHRPNPRGGAPRPLEFCPVRDATRVEDDQVGMRPR